MWSKNKNEMPSHDLLFGLDEIQPSNIKVLVEIRILERLVNKEFHEIHTEMLRMKLQFDRIDKIMETLQIGDVLFVEEPDVDGHSNFFKQKVLTITNKEKGEVYCIEPDTFQARAKTLSLLNLLTEKELSELK